MVITRTRITGDYLRGSGAHSPATTRTRITGDYFKPSSCCSGSTIHHVYHRPVQPWTSDTTPAYTTTSSCCETIAEICISALVLGLIAYGLIRLASNLPAYDNAAQRSFFDTCHLERVDVNGICLRIEEICSNAFGYDYKNRILPCP